MLGFRGNAHLPAVAALPLARGTRYRAHTNRPELSIEMLPSRQRRRRCRTRLRCMPAIALVMPLLLGGCGAERALDNATGFTAHLSCSCVFVSGRDLHACIADLPPETRYLDIALDRESRQVRVSALWVANVARYEEGRGCKLQD